MFLVKAVQNMIGNVDCRPTEPFRRRELPPESLEVGEEVLTFDQLHHNVNVGRRDEAVHESDDVWVFDFDEDLDFLNDRVLSAD